MRNLEKGEKSMKRKVIHKVISLNYGCKLFPKCNTGNDPYCYSMIMADKNNHMDVHFTPAAHFAEINEETLVYDDKLHDMLSALEDFANENDFNVIQIAGLIDPVTVEKLKEFGFDIFYAVTEGKCSCNSLMLPRRK